MKKPLRILLIEDDQDRAAKLRTWIPEEIKTVLAASAGRAIGILKLDGKHCGRIYAGIMLDHDLQAQAVTEMDRHLSGTQVVDSIIRHIQLDVPILVHSVSDTLAPGMVARLKSAGFSVTYIPMYNLTPECLNDWLKYVMDLWDDEE